MDNYEIPAPEGPPADWQTFARPTRQFGQYKKQTGGIGHFGLVTIIVEPHELSPVIVIENGTDKASLPAEYLPAIFQGLSDIIRGPDDEPRTLVGLRILIIDGVYHEVDSNPFSFRMAARLAMQAAIADAGLCPWQGPVKAGAPLSFKSTVTAYRANFLEQFRAFVTSVSGQLITAGFARQDLDDERVFFLRQTADLLHLVELGWRWHCRLHMRVGIMQTEVGWLVTGLRGWQPLWEKFEGKLVEARLGGADGYLPPLEATRQDIANAAHTILAQEAMPFFARWSDGQAVLSAVEEDELKIGTARYIALLHVLGHHDEARQKLVTQTAELSRDGYSLWKARILEAMQQRLDEE
ncbi:MAG: hypothetical protein KDE09_23710 [Anaerolineales bacterium]|nr:hypothetical protein [Anaerolineales bacterium]MCB8959653.1 hypothetical protein [Ardenticatenales bacterium]MCB0004986.1 hypothetical protein [Anaerolineales bacterium]MCB0013154.1 hypothetical protein [Anaerolineales bacterium]MCB0020830.1 hypothetical protein [Anaerolineales bacterium]